MRTHRPERISDLIIEELGKLLLKEVEVPGALLTITDVDVVKDLHNATVKVSVYPTEKSEEVFKILQKKQRELQFLLGRKMNIRPMPQIRFIIDYGQAKAAQIEKKLLESEEK